MRRTSRDDPPDPPPLLPAVARPGQDASSADRRFEALWSVDPVVVRDASRVAAALADRYRPDWRPGAPVLPDEDPGAGSADLHRASALFDRMLGYLDGR